MSAFLAVATADDAVVGQVFNTGTGTEISIREAALAVATAVGCAPPTFRAEDERKRPEKSEVERLLADSTKLRTTTGWKPQVELAEGLSQLVAWMRGEKNLERALSFQK